MYIYIYMPDFPHALRRVPPCGLRHPTILTTEADAKNLYNLNPAFVPGLQGD